MVVEISTTTTIQGCRQGGGGGAGGGATCPGPKQVGAPNVRNILKLNKAPSKSGRVQGIILTAAFKDIKGPV